MSYRKLLSKIMLLSLAAAAAWAAEEDHTWSLGGTLKAGVGSNDIMVAVTNSVDISAATVELHFNSAVLEYAADSFTLINRAADMTPAALAFTDFVRAVFLGQNGVLEAGSGEVARFSFKVKSGVIPGTVTTLSLTRKNGTPLLVTQQYTIQAGSVEEDHLWSLGGTLKSGVDSNAVTVAVTNTVEIFSATVELHFDSAVLEYAANSFTVTDRAADMTVASLAFTDFVRAVLVGQSGVLEAGSGDVAEALFKVKSGVAPGTVTTLSLTRKNGAPVLATQEYTIQAAARLPVPPVIVSPVGGREFKVSEGELLKVLFQVNRNGDSLFVQGQNLPDSAVFVSDTVLQWTTGRGDAGRYPIVVIFSNETGGADTVNLALVVQAVPPVIVSPANGQEFSVPEGSLLQVVFLVNRNGDSLYTRGVDLPEGVVFSSDTVLQWTTGRGDASRYPVAVIYTNETGGADTVNLTLVVQAVVPPPAGVLCDFNQDSKKNIADVITLLLYQRAHPGDLGGDFNADGKSGIADAIAMLLAQRNNTCPDPVSAVLSSAQAEEPVERLEGLSAGDIEYLEQLMDQLNLTPEEESAWRLVLYGYSGRAALPKAYSLSQNSPNPFNPATTISFSVPEGKSVVVSLKVYGLRGQLVRTLVEEVRQAGAYNVFWDGRDNTGNQVSSGVYLYRMSAGGFVSTRKMLLVK